MNKQNPIKEVNTLKGTSELKEGCGNKYTAGQLWDEVNRKHIARILVCGHHNCLCNKCKAKLQTLQKANKQFAEVLGEEIEFLERIENNIYDNNSDFDLLNKLVERISHLKQLKKEYDSAGEGK